MRRGRPLRRLTPLKQVSEKQQGRLAVAKAAVTHGGREFRDAIRGERCVVCGRSEREAFEETGWGHQAHHAISKQRLKRLGLLDLLWDPGNAVAACEEPCHRRHSQAYRPIRRSELPPRVLVFARSRPELKLAFEFEYPE